jgi:DNA polymerase III delta prime subunit
MSSSVNDELRIRRFSPSLKKDLKNIAENTGITLTSLLKSELRKLAESYPEKMKVKREV